jgi:probable HAF family extracellular repeat protein
MRIHNFFRRAIFCTALLFCAASVTRADSYFVQDLGTLGGNTSQAYALNNLGQVVGFSDTNNLYAHAVLFSGTGSNNIDLDVLGGNTTISEAQGINDSGQIVGSGTPSAGGRVEAILYKVSGNVSLGDLCDSTTAGSATKVSGNVSLGDLCDSTTAGSATAINNSGTAVGFADSCYFTAQPCRFSGTGTNNLALPGIGGGVSGVAYGINASGQIVGYIDRTDGGGRHAILFSGGSTVDLGTVGGATSLAYGINDAGQVVGTSLISGNSTFHATLFSGTGTNNIDLGSLGGGNSHAYAINNHGEIVGNAYPTNGSVYHAFIYKNGVMTDINGLVLSGSGFTNIRLIENGSRTPGRVINDSGQIAAVGEIVGRTHAVLLTPVLRKVSAARNGNNITVTFDAIAGKTYRLEWTATLTNPNWQSVPGVADVTAPSTGQAQFVQSNGATFGKEFYRVRLL